MGEFGHDGAEARNSSLQRSAEDLKAERPWMRWKDIASELGVSDSWLRRVRRQGGKKGQQVIADPSLPARSHADFEEIKKTDAQGDFWSARDLQLLMGYGAWRDFASAIDRAMISCEASGLDKIIHFAGDRKINDQGYEVTDVRLTRFGAYLVAMNGDPRKPEIALAQAYFAQREVERVTAAEVEPPTTGEALVQMMNGIMRSVQAYADHEKKITALVIVQSEHSGALSDHEHRLDGLEHRSGWRTALSFCKSRGLPSHLGFTTPLGAKAKQIGKRLGIKPGRVPDERFGFVNSWPEHVWEEALVTLT